MFLKGLSEEQKRAICKLKLEQYTHQQIIDFMEKEWNFSCSLPTVGRFFSSVEGMELLDKVREELVQEYQTEPLAEKFSRIHALVEKATRLRHTLRLMKTTDKEWVKLSKEFREYLKALRDETEPLFVEVKNRELSPYEQLEELLAETTKRVSNKESSVQ